MPDLCFLSVGRVFEAGIPRTDGESLYKLQCDLTEAGMLERMLLWLDRLSMLVLPWLQMRVNCRIRTGAGA